jgi:hypothetical protein
VAGSLSWEYYGEVVEGDEEWTDTLDLQLYNLDFSSLDPR